MESKANFPTQISIRLWKLAQIFYHNGKVKKKTAQGVPIFFNSQASLFLKMHSLGLQLLKRFSISVSLMLTPLPTFKILWSQWFNFFISWANRLSLVLSVSCSLHFAALLFIEYLKHFQDQRTDRKAFWKPRGLNKQLRLAAPHSPGAKNF